MQLAEIKKQIEGREALILQAKAEISALLDSVLKAYHVPFEQEMTNRGKAHGSVKKIIDGVTLTYELKPKVDWDQEKLAALMAAIPKEVSADLMTVKIGVSSRKMGMLTDPRILGALNDAKTVTYNSSIKLS